MVDASGKTLYTRLEKILAYAIGLVVAVSGIFIAMNQRNAQEESKNGLVVENIDPFDLTPGAGLDPVHNSVKTSEMQLVSGAPSSIDGDLSDWGLTKKTSFTTVIDQARVIKPALTDPTAIAEQKKLFEKFYKAQGGMREDAKNLYIAATIGDPDRLLMDNDEPEMILNLDDAATPANYLQIRYSTRPATEIAKAPTPPKFHDVQIHLWYSKEKKQARLGIWDGLGSDVTWRSARAWPPGGAVRPALDDKYLGSGLRTVLSGENGFECVFKQGDNENNCVIEAKIPWELLHRPAPDNKEIRCVWQIIRTQGGKKLRMLELLDKSSLPRADIRDSILFIDEPADPADGVALWGILTRKKDDQK